MVEKPHWDIRLNVDEEEEEDDDDTGRINERQGIQETEYLKWSLGEKVLEGNGDLVNQSELVEVRQLLKESFHVS